MKAQKIRLQADPIGILNLIKAMTQEQKNKVFGKSYKTFVNEMKALNKAGKMYK
jgi:hypothetical protein